MPEPPALTIFKLDGILIEGPKLLRLFIAEARSNDQIHLVATLNDGHVCCDISLMYLMHGQWQRSIALFLGMPVTAESPPFQVAKNASVTFSNLYRLGLARLEAMEAKAAAERGFSIHDPVLESARTGEPLEQALARLHHQNLGLRPVK